MIQKNVLSRAIALALLGLGVGLLAPFSLQASKKNNAINELFSERATLDYNSLALKRLLSSSQEGILKYYAAFMEYDTCLKSQKNIVKAKQTLKTFYEQDNNLRSTPFHYSFEQSAPLATHKQVMGLFFDLLTAPTQDNLGLPLWLVLKYPEVLNYNNGRYSPPILAPHSVKQLAAFEVLEASVQRAVGSYWLAPHGSIIRDINAEEKNFIDKISFAPGLITKNMDSIEENLIGFKAWSCEGLWNRLVYQQFEIDFSKAALALRHYYESHYDLQAHAPKAELILSKYVSTVLSGYTSAHSKAFQHLRHANGNDRALAYTADLTPTDMNEALSRAILMGYDKDTIAVFIEKGADVNAPFMGETPLMNATNNPELLTLLLAHGAHINAQTVLGKTALFYAIQFGDIKCVKILLDKGAKVNHALHSELSKTLSENQGAMPRFYLVSQVLSFTPLVYAKRYAKPDVMDLLIKKGATLGQGDAKKIKEWIQAGKAKGT